MYYLIENERIVAWGTERESCEINNQSGNGEIVEHSDYYNENDYIYSNGAFSLRTKTTEEYAQERRQERSVKFSQTLDKMNGAWYNALSAQQKTDLNTWRQAWLDYPSTGIKPDDLDWLVP
jgi:hypothetical protein